jgi:hypothetical protein
MSPAPKVTITRAGGYDPHKGPAHPDNHDETLDRHPLPLARGVWDDIERRLAAAMVDVARTFQALKDVRTRFNRCRLQASRDKLMPVIAAAEVSYRNASRTRDEIVAERRQLEATDRP